MSDERDESIRHSTHERAPDYGTQVLDQIVEAVETGLSYPDASRFAGIQHRKFRSWMRNAAKVCQGRASGTPIHKEYYPKILRAVINGKKVLLERIKRASERDWKAAAYLLERLERFQNYKTGDASRTDNVSKLTVELSNDEKARVLNILKTIDMKDIADDVFLKIG